MFRIFPRHRRRLDPGTPKLMEGILVDLFHALRRPRHQKHNIVTP